MITENSQKSMLPNIAFEVFPVLNTLIEKISEAAGQNFLTYAFYALIDEYTSEDDLYETIEIKIRKLGRDALKSENFIKELEHTLEIAGASDDEIDMILA